MSAGNQQAFPAFKKGLPTPGMTVRQYYKAAVAGAVLAKSHAEFVKSGIMQDVAQVIEDTVDAMLAKEGGA